MAQSRVLCSDSAFKIPVGGRKCSWTSFCGNFGAAICTLRRSWHLTLLCGCRQPFDQRLGNVLRRVWSRLMALLHRPKRENGDDDVLRGEGREFDKGALCTEGDFAFLLQVFMHCLLYHSAPEDLFCDAPSSFVATRQPILFDPVDADYLLGASGTVEPYLSDIAQVLSDWSALSLHRSEDCSKLESRHLLFLALNAKRLMDGMRRLDLIDSVRSFSSHLRDRKLAFSVDLAKVGC
ncbi:hypothetical protein DFJ74DRAFT_211666 [Hyaloraphidium curvatum]|nr:hypothetical protein DFJ74DRAFT_211666 [Hyaloraphidium curvatum]